MGRTKEGTMITFNGAEDRIVKLDFKGEITSEDFQEVTPKIEAAMAEQGKLKFLMDLTETKGFNLGAVYQDIKFDVQHFRHIGATAVVASRKTYEMMVKAIDAIYPEKVFHFEDRQSALRWLQGQAA
jgi:hypothetical protein